MTAFSYIFPAHRDTGNIDLDRQAEKIAEEASEVVQAVRDGETPKRIIEEALDCWHACETLLRAWPAEEVAEIRDKVSQKNAARGYYGDDR